MNFKRLTAVIFLALLAWAGLFGYTRIVAVSQGGTGASTAAVARDNLVWSGAGTIACASPCTPAAGITTVTVSGTTTINLPTISTYVDGQRLLIVCDSASTCPVTLDPSDSATCDGGSAGAACSSITVLAHGTVGAIRTGAAAWGSVQPGSLSPVGARGYIADGIPYMVATALMNGTHLDVGPPVAATSTADPSSYGCTMSGTLLRFPAAVSSAGTLQAAGQYWSWNFDEFDGLTLPTGAYRMHLQIGVTGFTEGARTIRRMVLIGLGSGPTTLSKALGIGQNNTGSLWQSVYAETSGVPVVSSTTTTARQFRGSVLVGNAGAGSIASDRYGASSAFEAQADLGSGAGLAAISSSITIYAYQQAGTTTTVWDLEGFFWSVNWTAL